MTSPPQNQPGSTHAGGASSGASGNGHDARQTAHEFGEKAKVEGQARLDDLRETAAGNVDRLADSVQAAASRLAQDDIGRMSQYVSNLADGMGRLSGSLRDKSGDELLREVGRLARENPALFVTGSIAIGFGLGRFARASQRPSQSSQLNDSSTSADGTSSWSSQPTGSGMPASGLGSSTGPGTGTGMPGPGISTAPVGSTSASSAGGSHQGTPGNPGSAGLPGGTPTGTRGGTH